MERIDRYVAIGDSSTAGWNDRDETGRLVGWSRRLAVHIASCQGGVHYANFGVRGLTTREILDQQLAPACELKPDLVTLFSGTNDAIHRSFDAKSLERDLVFMHEGLFGAGARTILTFTLPDLTPIMPVARLVEARIRELNRIILEVSSRTGATALDFASYPVATHPALWHEDRIHANSEGHRRIAAALASALGLGSVDEDWASGLPPQQPGGFLKRGALEFRWIGKYLVPWMLRAIRNEAVGKRDERRQGGLQFIEGASFPNAEATERESIRVR